MTNPTQLYHLEPLWGLLNDPVGLIWFKGTYHVFFQWNSLAKDHSSKEWGHFSSEDLVHWKRQESLLKPGQFYDRNGVYSGSSVVCQDRIFAYYTGNRKDAGHRTVSQCLAVSQDGYHFSKFGPVLFQPEDVTSHFRDPRVLFENGVFQMYIGAQNLEKQGMILNFSSSDGVHWKRGFMAGRSKKASMIECPDLIHFPDQDVLLYCLQNRDPETDECLDSVSVYKVLPGRLESAVDLDDQPQLLDAGFDCFAAQSLQAPDGRVLMFAWMNRLSDPQEKILADLSASIHCLSLPRELSVEQGKLMQRPAREIRSLFAADPLPEEGWSAPGTRIWHMDLDLAEQDTPFSMRFNGREAMISYDPAQSLFTLFRWDWAQDVWEERSCRTENLNRLEIYMDASSLEIFLNDGEKVLSARLLPTEHVPSIELACEPGTLHPQVHLPLQQTGSLTDDAPDR